MYNRRIKKFDGTEIPIPDSGRHVFIQNKNIAIYIDTEEIQRAGSTVNEISRAEIQNKRNQSIRIDMKTLDIENDDEFYFYTPSIHRMKFPLLSHLQSIDPDVVVRTIVVRCIEINFVKFNSNCDRMNFFCIGGDGYAMLETGEAIGLIVS